MNPANPVFPKSKKRKPRQKSRAGINEKRLEEFPPEGLGEEIEIVRKLIRKVNRGLEDESIPLESLVDGSVKVSLICTRLAVLLKAERELGGEEKDRVLEALSQAFDEALEERARE
jgi:hypothetical protein